jgi:hypothetical protein
MLSIILVRMENQTMKTLRLMTQTMTRSREKKTMRTRIMMMKKQGYLEIQLTWIMVLWRFAVCLSWDVGIN